MIEKNDGHFYQYYVMILVKRAEVLYNDVSYRDYMVYALERTSQKTVFAQIWIAIYDFLLLIIAMKMY